MKKYSFSEKKSLEIVTDSKVANVILTGWFVGWGGGHLYLNEFFEFIQIKYGLKSLFELTLTLKS